MAGLAQAARELEREPVRRFPLDAARVLGASTALTELRVRLPAGYRAQLPASVKADGPFGSYETVYAQQGDTLQVTRRLRGARGVLPPSARPQLAEWMRAVAKDDATFVVIARPAAAGAGR
jgi:hypothetical protein